MTIATPALKFVQGQELFFRGLPFKVDKVRDGVLYLDDQKSPLVDLPIDEVPRLFADGTLAHAAKRLAAIPPELDAKLREVELSQMTEDERLQALRNLEYVNMHKSMPRGRRSGAALAEALKEKARELGDPRPPSERKVYLMRRRFERANGDIRALVPRHKFKGCRKTKLSLLVETIIDRRIKENYLTQSEIPFSQLMSLIEGDVVEENARRTEEDQLEAPHAATVRSRLVLNFEPYEVMKARKGAAAADHHFRIVGRGPVYTRPLEMVLIDATQLDVVIVDPYAGRPIRPWITVVMDAYSRCILGFFISFAAPSRETTNQCLRHAFGYKGYLKEKYPTVRSDYPCFGTPNALSADNGSEVKNADVRLALASLGVDMHFNPAGQAY
ncbi:MAG: integrase catalytic domain-containing protein, partial [Acidimicrobiales bacterium]